MTKQLKFLTLIIVLKNLKEVEALLLRLERAIINLYQRK